MLASQYVAYATVALMCVIGLLHFWKNMRQYAPDTPANRYFRYSMLAVAGCALMEFGFVFHESGLVTNSVYCYFTEVMYSAFSLISCYFWFLSSETEQGAGTVSKPLYKILCTIPFAAMALLDLTTPWHHLLFYFTEDAHYMRGVLNTPVVLISTLFIAKSGICALIKSFRAENYLKRTRLLTYFYYALAILIAQILQILLGSVLPFRIIGGVFIYYLVQEKTIKENVFLDLLTGTNNRNAMDRYLKYHFEDADEHFALVMIDMDYFKQLNDRYGHTIGDKVLNLVAQSFASSALPGMFFGRYGGDEFVYAGPCQSEEDIREMMKKAGASIGAACCRENIPICPAFSYGVAFKTPDVTSIPDLISRADTAMYENKRKNKASA